MEHNEAASAAKEIALVSALVLRNGDAHDYYGRSCSNAARPEDAIARLRMALAIEPPSVQASRR